MFRKASMRVARLTSLRVVPSTNLTLEVADTLTTSRLRAGGEKEGVAVGLIVGEVGEEEG